MHDPPRILIVDDEPSIRELVSARLEQNQYEVDSAADGLEALSKVRSFKPDLIVLDLMLPKMDGYSFCRMLKSSGETDKIPVVMFTARLGDEDMRRGKEMGANAYVTKPFEPPVLLATIRRLLFPDEQPAEPEAGAAEPETKAAVEKAVAPAEPVVEPALPEPTGSIGPQSEEERRARVRPTTAEPEPAVAKAEPEPATAPGPVVEKVEPKPAPKPEPPRPEPAAKAETKPASAAKPETPTPADAKSKRRPEPKPAAPEQEGEPVPVEPPPGPIPTGFAHKESKAETIPGAPVTVKKPGFFARLFGSLFGRRKEKEE